MLGNFKLCQGISRNVKDSKRMSKNITECQEISRNIKDSKRRMTKNIKNVRKSQGKSRNVKN